MTPKILLLAGCAAFGWAGCGGREDVVVVGAKNFTEQTVLGELMAQAIEARTDLEVERRFDLGGTFVCFSALKRGDIDLYPEYTGTGLTAILKSPVLADADSVYDRVSSAFLEEFDQVWLQPFGMNNTYTLTMREADAESLGVASISDLKAHEESLRCGFTGEFMARPDGWAGLKRRYGLDLSRPPRELDAGLMYAALAEGEVDLICGFATDGRIPAFGLRVLEDDRGYFPPYYAAPLVRAPILEKHPELRSALQVLAGALDDSTMAALNFAVDQGGQPARKVAEDFLEGWLSVNKAQGG